MKISKDLKVAIVGEGFFFFEGANRVNKALCEIFPNADIYGFFGDKRLMEKYFKGHRYTFSKLQRIPLIKKIYKYTYFKWPIAVELHNLSKYDLVISSSYSCAMGCIVPYPTKHISYIHTPMRYAWDMKDVYFNKKNFELWKRLVIPVFLNYLRNWDVCASKRPDIFVSNSDFVSKRMNKYWKRPADFVIHPPVELYKGEIKEKRSKYFVTGGLFEFNKNGEKLLDFVKETGMKLKVIGRYPKRYARKYPNVDFLGRISDKEKYRVLSKAQGYITFGVEDFGIFPIEAMSCGTPVLYYKKGGVCESVLDGKTGMGLERLELEEFKDVVKRFKEKKWNYKNIAKYAERFGKERFKEEIKEVIQGL